MDRHTGKTKKHKACASEFDYLGWEDYGSWKRKVAGQRSPMDKLTDKLTDKPQFKHCENQCDFPSACHWKARHTPRKDANFEFLDPKSLGNDSKASPVSEKQETSSKPMKTGVYISRLVKAAEKRTTHLTTLLSTIADESNFASTPGFIPASTDKAPKLPELNLTFPVMDFSFIKQGLDDHQEKFKDNFPKTISPQIPPPQMSALLTAVLPIESPPDVDMTDWLSEDTTTSPPGPNNNNKLSFNFNIDIDTSTNQSPPSPSSSPSTEDESPVRSKITAWGWTAGEIGVALSSPVGKTIDDEIWDKQMDDTEGMWEKAAGPKRVEGEVGV